MAGLRLELPAPVAGRIPALDELRGVAILLVILYHVGGVLGMDNALHGEVGVDMFVILSGAGLALSQSQGGAGQFLLRRFRRIGNRRRPHAACIRPTPVCLGSRGF